VALAGTQRVRQGWVLGAGFETDSALLVNCRPKTEGSLGQGLIPTDSGLL